MALTRTLKGSAADKASGTSLAINDVSMNAGDLLVLILSFETESTLVSAPKYGKKEMRYIENSGATQGDTRVRFYRFRVRKTSTRNIVVTWNAAVTARAMIALSLTNVGKANVLSTNTHATDTGSPNSGTAVTTTIADTLHIAAFASLGGTPDTIGTAGNGHTLGARVGTSGPPVESNVTLQETHEILTATGDCRASLTGATARKWAVSIVAFRSTQVYTVSRAEYYPFDGYPAQEKVIFVMKDESGDEKFTVTIPRFEFEAATDQEITDRITGDCVWWENKVRDDAPSPDFTPDSAFNTRVASFVNDTVIV